MISLWRRRRTHSIQDADERGHTRIDRASYRAIAKLAWLGSCNGRSRYRRECGRCREDEILENSP